jgi:hypothetical protein
MFERVGAKKTEKGVAVFLRAYGICTPRPQEREHVQALTAMKGARGSHKSHVLSMNHVNDVHRFIACVGDQK